MTAQRHRFPMLNRSWRLKVNLVCHASFRWHDKSSLQSHSLPTQRFPRQIRLQIRHCRFRGLEKS